MHGEDYKLLHLLNCVEESDIAVQYKPTRLRLAEEKVRNNLRAAYERKVHQCNLRSKLRYFDLDKKVFVRNFSQSDASKNYNAKLDRKSLPAVNVKK